MKKILTSKLKSNSGASLMAALLFFIMAATVGSIILAAATASSGRLAGLKEEDQGYYAVTSAMDYISKTIADSEVILVYEATGDKQGTVPAESDYALSEGPELNTLLGTMVNDQLNDSVTPHQASISVDGYDQLDVDLTFMMDSNYDLTVVLKPETSNSDAVMKNSLTLHFPSVQSESVEITEHHNIDKTDRTTKYKKRIVVSWVDCTVTRGSEE